MASPSPLDRCWILNDSPSVLPILPAVRAAVEQHWPDTQRAAATVLGDESLAAEIMEEAIEKAVAYLADHPPEDHQAVSAILSRFCKEAVGRRRKQRAQLVFIDFSVSSEPASSDLPFSAAEAAIDAERILRDAPAEVREAFMLRYGCSDSWRDVAAVAATSPGAIRKKCKRHLERIRRKLGIRERQR
jgi:DNA-directed RNA polymerase specialized sigma24 family protein